MSQQKKYKPGYLEATDSVPKTGLKTCQEMDWSFAVWATLKACGRRGQGLV